ncbi:MAG TPA: polysaccharide biosynthesis/export family protein [Bdellovibrionota bacterium]|nr:polysaccharide biosynthesis/export family protein [Bdellovibrionota bacterium]
MDKNNRLFFLLLILMILNSCATKKQAPQSDMPLVTPVYNPAWDSRFRVGPHTKLKINVYQEPELSEEVLVLNDGTIAYAFLGSVQVGGLTPRQIENRLTGVLEKDYLVKPQVRVHVIEWGQVYVLGHVQNPGLYKMKEQQSALELVVAAGGFTQDAKREAIKIVRNWNGKKLTHTLQLKVAQGGLDLQTEIALLPGDTLIVE